MKVSSTLVRWALAGLAASALVVVPSIVDAHDDAGFDGYVQSGTCAAPTDDLRVKLDSDGPHDVEPYVAMGADGEPVTLGYYGAPEIPGFGVSVIYTDQRFSLVIADDEGPIACGDILEPIADKYGEAGLAVVQLLPVGTSTVHGLAAIERTTLEREHDVIPARVRIILSADDVVVPTDAAPGYDGYVQGGVCASPADRLRVQLKSRSEHDVQPFTAAAPDSGEPVTVAYYGSPGAPGFGLASAYTDQDFSLVIADIDSGQPVACGDVLEPADDAFTDAGLALVALAPVGDDGVQGYALIERLQMERELDITPTRIRIVLFAPPVVAG